MLKEDCFYLGLISKKYSFKGEVVIKMDTDQPELYQNLSSIFINLGDDLVPFFIEKIKLQKGNQLRVKFESIDSQNQAQRILKSSVYLPLELLPPLEGNKFYYHEIINFDVQDIKLGFLGKIKGVKDTASHPLFVIDKKGVEILVPMIDNFIKEINRKEKKIILETPQGLIQIYLDKNK